MPNPGTYRMAGVRVLLGVLVLGLSVSSLELTGPSVQAARLGSDARVPCPFTVDNPPVDPEHVIIFWFFRDKEILSYYKTVMKISPKYSLSPEALRSGIADLTISNIQIPDWGMYKCSVTYRSERKEKNMWLDIGAPPQVTITGNTVVMNKESVLRCFMTGFFPIDIGIRWFRDGKRLTENVVDGVPWRNPDKTYSVEGAVTIIPTEEDRGRNFSLRILHKYLQEPFQEDFQLVYREDTPAGIIAACCVLVVLLVVLIAGALWWKLRRANRLFKVGTIVSPSKLIDGEEATLYCTVDDCPENLSVTWLMRRAGQEQEIQTSQIREHSEEEESLLDTSYVIRSKQEGRQYETSLSFKPHIERHKGVTFICRGDSKEHKEEKTFHCPTIYEKPKMPRPVMRSLCSPEEIKYTLNLVRFYPKNIKIKWTCGEGPSPTQSTSDNPDGTHSVSSEVRIPEDRHKDPGFRVRVTWEHESMDGAESRELSVRDEDYPWTPVVEKIQVPRLLHGSPAVLLCKISKYFPDDVTVTWWRRPEQSPQLYEVPDALTQIMTPRRAADNTYSCTARLTIAPTRGTHQGAEYICKVEHPSLEKPIEKSTGRLQVYGFKVASNTDFSSQF